MPSNFIHGLGRNWKVDFDGVIGVFPQLSTPLPQSYKLLFCNVEDCHCENAEHDYLVYYSQNLC